ncbi:hypothetical protein ES703_97751 [subsurface metagenome]
MYSIILARENKENNFAVGNIFDILYKDNYFDLILTAGVLIHINPEDLLKALKEIFRVTKKYYLMLEYNEDYKEFKISIPVSFFFFVLWHISREICLIYKFSFFYTKLYLLTLTLIPCSLR